MKVVQVLHLPRKTSLRCCKCCACHAKRGGGAPSATQNEAAPKVINCRRASADLYDGAPSAAPATQNEPEVLQVLHLPRKTGWRCSNCCACHAKRGGAQNNQLSPGFGGPEGFQVLNLPRKTSLRCSKCCTCHTKRAGGAPSAAPATQSEAAPKVINCRRACADLYEGAPSAAPATQNETEVLQVLQVPRRMSLRCSKCCTCHAKRAGGAPSAAPATQNEAAPKVINCRRASADLYEGAPSAAPATQNEPELLQVLQLPQKNEAEVLQVLRLPCKTRRRPK